MKVADLFAKVGFRVDQRSKGKVDRAIASVKRGLIKMAAVAGVAAFATAKLVSSTAATADHLAKMSKKVGISVEKLQQLEFAAGISGTSLGTLRTGLQRFARTADDAGQGLESAQEPFERLGINTKNAKGELKDLDTLLLDAADAFSKMPDGTEKTALAMKSFGRAGAELIPLLNEGRGGIEKLRAEFESMGGQLSSEDTKAFEEYNDTLLRTKTVLTGLKNQAVVALLPHLKKGSAALLAWAKANRVLIKQKLASVMKGVAKAIGFLFKVFGFMIEHGRTLVGVFIALKIAMVAFRIASKKAALTTAWAWALANAPIILMLLLIGLLVLAVQDFISFLQGKDSVLGRVFGDSADAWREDITDFFMWFVDKFHEMGLIADDFISLATGRKSKRDKEREARVFKPLLDDAKKRKSAADRKRIDSIRNRIGDETAYNLGQSAPSLGAAPTRQLSGAAAINRDGSNWTVNVTGAADPIATGNEVMRQISQQVDKK